MATKNYTETEIKILVLDQINKIKDLSASFDSDDSTESFDQAVRECGFGLPLTTDTDKDIKYHWLIQRMRRFFMWSLLEQYSLRFKTGDLEAQQITKQIKDLCEYLDKQFNDAKSEDKTASLFLDSDDVFGDKTLVMPTGLIEDRIGQSIEDR